MKALIQFGKSFSCSVALRVVPRGMLDLKSTAGHPDDFGWMSGVLTCLYLKENLCALEGIRTPNLLIRSQRIGLYKYPTNIEVPDNTYLVTH
jgi:hypothetical protein